MAVNPETIPGELTTKSLYADTFTTNVTNLNGIDTRDYLGKLKVVMNAGDATNDNQAANVKLQHSAEVNANFEDFDPGISFEPLIANAEGETQSLAVDTRMTKRYLRPVLTRAAAGNGRAISITATGKEQVNA